MTTRTVTRSLLAAGLAGAACLVAVPSALSATPDTVYEPVRIEAPEPQAQGRFGERSALAGDIDGDGVGDFFMSAFQQNVGDVALAGRVYLISGAARAVIRSFTSPEPQREQRFGFTVSSPGDLNADGKRDVVVGADVHDDFRGESSPGVPDPDPCGAPEPNGCYENTGQAWAYSGATGELLYALENPEPQSNPELPFSKIFGFGVGISSAGDLTGDGTTEVLVGAMSNDVPRGCGGQVVIPPAAPGAQPTVPPAPAGCRRDQGQGFVFNGATGAPLRTYNLPPGDERPEACSNVDPPGPGIGTCGVLGFTAQGVGDVDNDGFVDHLLDAGTYGPNKDGRIYVFSGDENGKLLLRIDNPSPTSAGGTTRIFGLQTVQPGAPGDVNQDGFDDIYGNGFQSAGPTGNAGEGRAWMFSGRDGSILYNLFDPSPEVASGFAFSGAMTDFDLDGRPEFFAGQNGSGAVSGGGASIFGRPGVFGPTAVAPALKDFEPPVADRQATGPPPAANGLRFGRTVEGPGDLNQDGQPDYVVGAPQTDVGANADQGRVYVFLSSVPATPGTPPPPAVPPPAGTGPFTAKLALARATINRRDRTLDVLAPITSLASGRVRVELQAAGRRFRFTAPVDSRAARIRFRKRIPAAQARLGTGILTIAYPGDADTRPQTVRLRAASQRADLRLSRPTIDANGRLRASGSVSRRARGVVRVQIEYVADARTTTLQYLARIRNGRWSLNQRLAQTVRDAIARRNGTVHSYTLFTGYQAARMRGEMRSFQILGPR